MQEFLLPKSNFPARRSKVKSKLHTTYIASPLTSHRTLSSFQLKMRVFQRDGLAVVAKKKFSRDSI